jgi:hypothetical protein
MLRIASHRLCVSVYLENAIQGIDSQSTITVIPNSGQKLCFLAMAFPA